MSIIGTGKFESVKCPICQNIKEIEITHVLYHIQYGECDHSIKDYMNLIEEQDKLIRDVKAKLELLKEIKEEFIIKIKAETNEIIEFCRKPSKETWGTLSEQIIKMLGGKP